MRGKEGGLRGGPAYYIEKALGHRWLGILFAVLLILCYAFGFNGLQAYNAVLLSTMFPTTMKTAAMITGLFWFLMTATVIFGGQKRISVITSYCCSCYGACVYLMASREPLLATSLGFQMLLQKLFESAF